MEWGSAHFFIFSSQQEFLFPRATAEDKKAYTAEKKENKRKATQEDGMKTEVGEKWEIYKEKRRLNKKIAPPLLYNSKNFLCLLVLLNTCIMRHKR